MYKQSRAANNNNSDISLSVNDGRYMDIDKVAACINSVIAEMSDPNIVESNTIESIKAIEETTGFSASPRLFKKPNDKPLSDIRQKPFLTEKLTDDYEYLLRNESPKNNATSKYYDKSHAGSVKEINDYDDQLKPARRYYTHNDNLCTVADNLLKSRVKINHSFYYSGCVNEVIKQIPVAQSLTNISDY